MAARFGRGAEKRQRQGADGGSPWLEKTVTQEI